MISKFHKPKVIVRKAQPTLQASQPVEAKPVVKKERPYRIFHYREIPFFCKSKGDTATIHSWDSATNSPGTGIQVPNDKIKQAVTALAKITLAEQELEKLGAKVNNPE